MNLISQIQRLGIWIFFIPVIAVNLCLLVSINYHYFENTIFVVDQIGRSGFSIPYIDGSLSISRASRTYPQFLIFKPAMVITAFLLYFYWKKNNLLINYFNKTSNNNYKFKTFGILSAIFLVIHSLLLGVEFDIKIFKLLRRIVLLGFIIFEIIAQSLLVISFYKLKNEIINFYNKKVLTLKIILVSLLASVAILSLPILISKGDVHFKHALEWNYFIGVTIFYLFTRFFWKTSTT